MAQQMTFDLPVKTALGREDFFISAANALAVEMLENWPKWPNHKLALIGPKGAGKTHLTQVWAADTGATVIPARTLADADIPTLCQAPVAVEDIREIASDMPAQKALFHLHNLMQQIGTPLLLTADTPPNHWALSLPDLQSRMAAATITTLPPPDDALLSAVLVKLFADRQINVAPRLIAYLLKRMDRSFDAAGTLVAALDKAALTEGRAISQSVAARVLDNPPEDTA
ncbi:MAG: chromosomal replication initiator DnaA [Marinosulfonomonas sp.]|nr:chromosomal replication initiator DnaA [Marinosulfonomonas sp.]